MGNTVNDLPIGVFDSGLGGLTVVSEIMRALPSESVHYFGDTARWPYGPKPLDDVRDYVLQIGSWLTERPVKLLVVACNTGTAAGLEAAQKTFDVPVVGVVEPGARAAVQSTTDRRVGVIGTIGTVESGAYSDAVRALDAGATVFSVATPKFVDVVEAGLRLGPGPLEDWLSSTADVFVRPTFHEIARDYLAPLKRSGIDTLILGCTHFPLLAAAIQQVIGPGVRLISSAEETAKEVGEILAAKGQTSTADAEALYHFTSTGDAQEFRRLGSRVLRTRIEAVEHIDVSVLEALEIAGQG